MDPIAYRPSRLMIPDYRHVEQSEFNEALENLKIDFLRFSTCRIEMKSGLIHSSRLIETYRVSLKNGCLRLFTEAGNLDTFIQLKDAGLEEVCVVAVPGDRYCLEVHGNGQKAAIKVWFKS